jgi:hypothetical protein
LTIQKIQNGLLYGVSGDTKPTNDADNTLFVETDTGNHYRRTGGAWVKILSNDLTQTLSNKTVNPHDNVVPYGVMSSYLNSSGANKRFSWMYNTTGGALNNYGGFSGAASSAGTVGGAAAYNPANPAIPYPITSGAVSGNQGRVQWPLQTRWADGPRVRIQFKLSTTTSIRFFVGWTTNATFPSTDTFFGTTESGMGMGKRSTDTALNLFKNNGTGMAVQALSPAPTDTAMTSIVSYEIWVNPTADTFNFTHDGGTTVQSFAQSGTYPADNTILSFVIAVGTSAAAAKTLSFYTVDGENT